MKGIHSLQNKVVSSEREDLILVDSADNEIGYLSKAECHDGDGLLHRAFSVFIFDADGRLLLQQRGNEKRLWPGYWSNSCCSHPRKGESMSYATSRRLREELGIDVDLEYVYQFQYQASYGKHGSEHELCSVYLGRCMEFVRPNATEIEAIRFIPIDGLKSEMKKTPDSFTPWFIQEWERLASEYSDILARFTREIQKS